MVFARLQNRHNEASRLTKAPIQFADYARSRPMTFKDANDLLQAMFQAPPAFSRDCQWLAVDVLTVEPEGENNTLAQVRSHTSARFILRPSL
jgi:hypothetical protein